MYKISVIIPVYNAEKYLDRCITSVINQTYKNLEVILVDDGSMDNSLLICEIFKNKDSRISILHQANSGVSAARNHGLDYATGEYIAFVDSDDYISPLYMEYMIKSCVDDNCDMALCHYKIVNELSKLNDFPINHIGYRELHKKYYNAQELCQNIKTTGMVFWNKLYHRKIFYNIRIPTGMIHEDEAVMHEILFNAKKCVELDCVLYFYCMSPKSIIRSAYSKKKLDAVAAYERRMDFYKKHKEWYLYYKAMADYLHVVSINYYKCRKYLKNDEEVSKELKHKFDKTYKVFMDNPSTSFYSKARLSMAYIMPATYGKIFDKL